MELPFLFSPLILYLKCRTLVTAQVVKTRITLQLATAERLREAETAPLHLVGRLHMRR